MTHWLKLAVLAAVAGLSVSSAQAQDLGGLFGGGLKGEALAKAIAEADKHPLGSEANPVRVNMPPGERAYLSRLRCPDGKRPKFDRAGSMGIGVFGNILDLYMVECKDVKPAEIYMDMYHKQKEDRPVPGFTIE